MFSKHFEIKLQNIFLSKLQDNHVWDIQSNVVYRFVGLEFQQIYLGQTKLYVKDSVMEHKYLVSKAITNNICTQATSSLVKYCFHNFRQYNYAM